MSVTPAIHLCVITPRGYIHADGLLDPARYFFYQFRRLGARVSLARNCLRHDAVNFVFGAHLGFDATALQTHSCIIVNLEQVGEGGAALSPDYTRLLKSTVVVDYDAGNPAAYTDHPQDVPLISFGHAPYLAPQPHQALPLHERPVDLLFIGSINQRRQDLIRRIRATGRRVECQRLPVYGSARDNVLRQAKALLNLHFYDTARFEQVRAFTSLSCGTPVLSERHASSRPSPAYDACVTWFDDALIAPLFGSEFGTPFFYEVMTQQLTMFAGHDPVEEYADLLGFARGVWQAQQSVLKPTGQDRMVGPRMLLPLTPEIPHRVLIPGIALHEDDWAQKAMQKTPGATGQPPSQHGPAQATTHAASLAEGVQQTDAATRTRMPAGDLPQAGRIDAPEIPWIQTFMPTEKQPFPLFQPMADTCHAVNQLIAAGQPNEALVMLVNDIASHYFQPGIECHALYYPDLDACVQALSDQLDTETIRQGGLTDENGITRKADQKEETGRPLRTLLMATSVAPVGGHGKLLEEIALHAPNPLVIFSNLGGEFDDDDAEATKAIRQRFGARGIAVDFLRAPDTWGLARQLRQRVQAEQATHIWYMQNHQDPVPLIGTLGHAASRKILVHHCDHNPSLGCTLPGVAQAEITDLMLKIRAAHLHEPGSLLPLSVADRGRKPQASGPQAAQRLSVVMAGRQGKFTASGPLALGRIISTALRAIDGHFYHIGPLSADMLEAIRRQLVRDRVKPGRFVHVGTVDSVWLALKTLDAQVYIGSAPASGGLSAVEAQGCGYPVLPFTGFEAGSLLADYSSYADVSLGWKDLDELAAQLKAVAPRCAELSDKARRFYEQNFSESVFRARVRRIMGLADADPTPAGEQIRPQGSADQVSCCQAPGIVTATPG